MDYALEIKNLAKRYDGFILDNISFSLPAGCIMGLIGENGAGKSTIIKLILNLIHKDDGDIKVLGLNLDDSQTRIKENIGVIFDESSFPDNLCIYDINIIMKNIYTTWNEEKFIKYTNKFSLPGKKVVKDYSRGMKMKLSIAGALSHDSKLLILDEATSGLDPIIRDEILDVFLDFIQDETHSILLSSHIISDLEKICDYITFIHNGRLFFCEGKDTLKDMHGILKCSASQFEQLDKSIVKGYRKNSFGVEALVLKDKVSAELSVDPASIEDIMLFCVKENLR
jgi:ABC-2 type transport system ATP-binding protein